MSTLRTPARPARHNNDTVKFRHLTAPLTGKQRSVVGMQAGKAFAFAQRCHAIDHGMTADTWRHEEAVKLIGCRVKEAVGEQFPTLMAHFCGLAGEMDQMLYWTARISHAAQRCANLLHLIGVEIVKLPALEGEDTQEEMAASRWAWVDAIAVSKFGGTAKQLNASQLGTLHSLVKAGLTKEQLFRRAVRHAAGTKGGQGA